MLNEFSCGDGASVVLRARYMRIWFIVVIVDVIAPSRFLTEVVGTHTRHPGPSGRCHS